MTSEEIFKTMQDLIAEQFAVNADDVTMNSSFEDDLSADSVDLVELVMAMEEEFEIDEIPEEVRAAIKKVTLTPGKHGDRVCVELHDKVAALEKLGKYLELWTDKTKVENTGPAQAQINVYTGVPRPPDGVETPEPEDYSDL